MTFNEAWNEIADKIAEAKQTAKTPAATVKIIFHEGTATLHAPKFFKNPDEAKDTVALAWKTYCRGKAEYISQSITGLQILSNNEVIIDSDDAGPLTDLAI